MSHTGYGQVMGSAVLELWYLRSSGLQFWYLRSWGLQFWYFGTLGHGVFSFGTLVLSQNLNTKIIKLHKPHGLTSATLGTLLCAVLVLCYVGFPSKTNIPKYQNCSALSHFGDIGLCSFGNPQYRNIKIAKPINLCRCFALIVCN